jgi:hypothetical protein
MKGIVASNVLITKFKLGSRYLLSGVGTHIIIASTSLIREKSVVASIPASTDF